MRIWGWLGDFLGLDKLYNFMTFEIVMKIPFDFSFYLKGAVRIFQVIHTMLPSDVICSVLENELENVFWHAQTKESITGHAKNVE